MVQYNYINCTKEGEKLKESFKVQVRVTQVLDRVQKGENRNQRCSRMHNKKDGE